MVGRRGQVRAWLGVLEPQIPARDAPGGTAEGEHMGTTRELCNKIQMSQHPAKQMSRKFKAAGYARQWSLGVKRASKGKSMVADGSGIAF